MGKGACVAAASAVVALMTAAAAHGATAGQIIDALNTQRSAAGLPAGITENASWSSACAKHNAYQAAHGGQLIHGEPDKQSPTYSPEGDAVSLGAVLSTGTWDKGNPFESAPIHLHQLLAPRLNVVGANESSGFSCTTTFGPPPQTPGYARPPAAKATISTYPGENTPGLPGSEIADEGPFTPGEVLGIPRGTVTGRYIMILVDGPWTTALPRVDVITASVKPVGGEPVEIKIADRDVKTPDGRNLGDYLPQGAQLIPVKPLAENTRYEVSVQLTVQGTPLSKTFSFGTGAAGGSATPTAAALPRLTIDRARYRSGRLRFTIRAGKLLVGRRATLSFKVRGRKAVRRKVTLRATTTVRFRSRRATLTVSVPAFTSDGTRYGPFRATRTGRAG